MSDPNHIYLDLDIINNNYSQSGPPPYLRFEEIRHTLFWTATARSTSATSCDSQVKRATPCQCSFRASSLGKTTQTRPDMQLI